MRNCSGNPRNAISSPAAPQKSKASVNRRGSPSETFAGYRLEMREAGQQRDGNQERRTADPDYNPHQQISSRAFSPVQSQIGEGARFENRHGECAGKARRNQRWHSQCDHGPPQELGHRARQVEQHVIAEGE